MDGSQMPRTIAVDAAGRTENRCLRFSSLAASCDFWRATSPAVPFTQLAVCCCQRLILLPGAASTTLALAETDRTATVDWLGLRQISTPLEPTLSRCPFA